MKIYRPIKQKSYPKALSLYPRLRKQAIVSAIAISSEGKWPAKRFWEQLPGCMVFAPNKTCYFDPL